MNTFILFLFYLGAYLVFVAAPVLAQNSTDQSGQFDTLAGDLPAIILPSDKPYLIVDDIYVPNGKTVNIEAGTVLLFNNFTGLQVQGRLIVKGKPDTPVVFTSVNDKENNPASGVDAAPYDWNGIYLHEDAIGSEFHYSAVMYSVEGILSKTRFVKIAPVLFLHNGRASLTIEGEEHDVGTQPYDYAVSITDPTIDGIPLSVLDDPLRTKRTVLRYTGLTLAVGGIIAGIFYSISFDENDRIFSGLSSKDADNLAANSTRQWEDALHKRNRNLAGMLIGWSLTVAGAGGLYWSFTF